MFVDKVFQMVPKRPIKQTEDPFVTSLKIFILLHFVNVSIFFKFFCRYVRMYVLMTWINLSILCELS